jgi:predicted transcriptional regulator
MMNPNGNEPLLTTKIVSKYVSHHRVAVSQLPELINTVHQAMGQLGQPAQPKEERTPAVSVRQSIRHDYVVCLDCGYRGLVLRRHLRVRHGLSPDEYRQRWGLKRDHAVTAPAYSERRSSVAKALGLGRKPANQVVKAEETLAPVEAVQKSAATSKPARKARGSTKRADKPATTRRSRQAASEPRQPTSSAAEP